MRTTVPIIPALVISALLVACRENPVEPLSNAGAPNELTPSAVITNEWLEESQWEFEGCGEMNTVWTTAHILERWTETPNGDWKWGLRGLDKYVRIVGQDTGNEYYANAWPYKFWIKGTWGEPTWHEHQTARLVAHGVNADLDMHATWLIHFKRLDTGEVVMDRFVNDVWCK